MTTVKKGTVSMKDQTPVDVACWANLKSGVTGNRVVVDC